MNPTARCPHCQQDTLVTISSGDDPSGHCTNRACNGYFVTLPMSQFMALTPAQLASYQCGEQHSREHDPAQAAFESHLEAMMQQIAQRQAARSAGERLYA